MGYKIVCADVLDWAAEYSGPPFHAVLCDPPYNLTEPVTQRFGTALRNDGKWTDEDKAKRRGGFMGKKWDSGVAFQPETWAAIAEHLHPGAFIMAFGGSRTVHRLMTAMEDAGLDCDEQEITRFQPMLTQGPRPQNTPRKPTRQRNPHPTVKPIALCRWLATLLLPPAEYAPRRILVPFAGSGSEMRAAGLAGFEEIVGVELMAEYAEIAEARLAHWLTEPEQMELIP